MRIAVLAITMTACASASHLPYVEPVAQSALLSELLARVALWVPTESYEHLEIDVNDLKEGIGFERISGKFQLWTSICGPEQNQHFAKFEEFAKVHGLDCSPFSSERLDGCNHGHICTYPGLSGAEFASVGQQALAEVFGVDSSAAVRFVLRANKDS